MKPRAYSTSETGKLSGIIVVSASRRVNLIPAMRWLPAREITRDNAARILREARMRTRLIRRKANPWECL